MDKETAKQTVMQKIEQNSDRIIDFANDIWDNPELGFKEHRTAGKVMEFFDELGLQYKSGMARTGVRADVSGKSHKYRIAVLGELDAVTCGDHPDADPETGAVHACGHHGQLAVMLGTALGLISSGLSEQLSGDLSFIAVPAEEFVELDFRNKLKEKGEIEFFGGKQELIRQGIFDDIDMAAMVHHQAETPERVIKVSSGSNGFVGKEVIYKGQESHAGAAPHQGVNALNAAMLGLMGIHAQRETFKDEDAIRVHPIITKGGDLVNIVPSDVKLETYVRGRNINAILDANKKVNKALKGGAYTIGAEIDIKEIPGYLPVEADPNMNKLYGNNVQAILGDNGLETIKAVAGSTDMGDISQLMPAIHPYVGGVEGKAHARDYKITDPTMAYVIPAKAMACMIIDLLWDDAREAKNIKEYYQPQYTKEDYLKMWRSLE
ncbi:amidohydrolase [Natranaerobius trueperi]|uniref:Peptidase M20 domain-containing protein 2 n=2 Tax=Natranaerobius trueperi TaxID=759412 RepID=A0A226C0Z4_9FIRM|nr:amidohydrolase [Natranaerobius trueperi]